MASVKLALTVGLMLAVALATEDPTRIEEWEDLEIRSKVAAAMPYGNFRLDIYELQRGQKPQTSKTTYAYTPVVQLDHKSARSLYNPITDTHEVVFQISFWNNEVQKAVVNYLREELGHPEVKASDVTVIRFNKVMLTTTHPSRLYSLSKKWENYRQEKTIHFSLYCKNAEDSERVAELMRTKPELFSGLQMGFTVSSRTSKTSYVTIKAESISNGKFFSKLSQRYPKADSVLLTAEDTNQLISESATNVVVESFSETEAINPNSAIYNELRNILVQSTVVVDEANKALWNSVFWDQDNYRPDKTSQTISDVYDKSDEDNQKKMRDFLSTEKVREENQSGGGSVSGGFGGFSASASFNFAKGFRNEDRENNEKEREEMMKILREAKNRVEWQGTKFVPKQMTLSRVNIGNVRKKSDFSDVKTTVTYATVGLSMRVVIESSYKAIEESPLKIQVEGMEEVLKNHTQRLVNIGNLVSELRSSLQSLSKIQEQEIETRKEKEREKEKEKEKEKIKEKEKEMDKGKAKALTLSDLNRPQYVFIKNVYYNEYLFLADYLSKGESIRRVLTAPKLALPSPLMSPITIWRVDPVENGRYIISSADCRTANACALYGKYWDGTGPRPIAEFEGLNSEFTGGYAGREKWTLRQSGSAFQLENNYASYMYATSDSYGSIEGSRQIAGTSNPGQESLWVMEQLSW